MILGLDVSTSFVGVTALNPDGELISCEAIDLRKIKDYFKKNDLIKIINENISLMSELDSSINISLNNKEENLFINCDAEQLNRIFINLLKNSIESINEKFTKKADFTKKIDIEINAKDDYIEICITDNGIGFEDKDLTKILKPYFTTKKNGSGLGLPIVNKIINDHNGDIKFNSDLIGTNITINLPTK